MEPTEEDTGQIEERIQQLEKQLDGVRKRTREMLSNRDSTNESFTIEAA
jgi:50S ribosomal subunit-associated GTPase HflX